MLGPIAPLLIPSQYTFYLSQAIDPSFLRQVFSSFTFDLEIETQRTIGIIEINLLTAETYETIDQPDLFKALTNSP